MAEYVIGVDCSTTATKAVVWDRDGLPVAEGRQRFPVSIPRAGYHEQDAEDWWRSTAAALRDAATAVGGEKIGAIGLTHQRESFVCLGEDGRPLRPAILWLDFRCTEEVDRYGTERVHRITGKVPDPTPSLYKLHWLREHEPEALDRAAKIVDVHGFLVNRLTGGRAWRTSWASADPMGLVDMERLDWSDEILADVGLERHQLCELVAPGTVVGELDGEVAREVGLPAGLPLVAGAGDGQAAGLGANVTTSDRAYLNLGTAIVSGTSSDEYRWARAFRSLAGPVAGTYTLETLLRSGTYIISWLVERFTGPGEAFDGRGGTPEEALQEAAAQLPAGSDGLLVLPYWNTVQRPPWDEREGAGVPAYWDRRARGVIWGLRGHHTKAHAYRAVLESLALEQRLHTAAVEAELGTSIEQYVAMGGGAQSPLWCQIVADATRRPLAVSRTAETSSLGAAMLAAAAIGWYDGPREAAAAMSEEQRRYEPDPGAAARYDAIADVYRQIYPALAPLAEPLTDALEGGEQWQRSLSAATTPPST